MLFYSNNLVTHAIGIVFYHNGEYGVDAEEMVECQDYINAVIPSRQILKKGLKLDEVHTFGDLSKSQLIEKIDYLTEISIIYMLKNAQKLKQQTFITIISLAMRGYLAESNEDRKRFYRSRVDL